MDKASKTVCVIIDQQVENIDHIAKQLHFGYVKNRSSFVCINAEYMKHEKKINFIWPV